MRTAFAALAAIGLVACTAAAAANFDVNDADATLDDASTGSSAIEDCTDGLHLDLLHSQDYDETINDWYVTGVRVAAAGHDLDVDPVNLLDTCLDLALSVAIDDDQGDNHIVLGPVVLDADTVTDGIIELPVPDGTLIAVRDVHETSALVEHDPAAPADGGELDTSQTGEGLNPSYWGGPRSVAQTFTPTRTGQLTAIDLRRLSGTTGPMTLTIRNGTGPNGAVLGTTSNVHVPATDEWTRIDLDTPVPVIAGQAYTFRVDNYANGLRAASTGPARDTGASFYSFDGSNFPILPGADTFYRTYVK